MNSLDKIKEARAVEVEVGEDELTVRLDDGRTITTPVAWYPRLLHATETERNHFRIVGKGLGIHWPDLDEDISVDGLLAGRPSGEGRESLKRWMQARKV